MSLTSKIFRALFSLLLVVAVSATVFADTIRLKDGSIIKGKIVGFNGGKFTVSMGSGTRKREMTFGADEIESIDFDQPQQSQQQYASVPVSRPVSKPDPVIDNRTIATPTDNGVEIREEEDVVVPEPAVSQPTVSAPPVSTPTRKVSYGKPVELSVKVMADNTANGWTNSGWVVKKGQKIRISGTGEVLIGQGKKTGPSGLYDVADGEKLLKSVPTGALIAVIGDDNNDFIYVGAEREFVAARDGALFLGLNEGNLNDNTGSFQVKVEISPEGGE